MPAVQIPSKLLSSKRWVGGQRLQNLRLKLGYLVRCEANEAGRANPHYCFHPPGLHPLRIKWCWSSASRPAPAPRRAVCGVIQGRFAAEWTFLAARKVVGKPSAAHRGPVLSRPRGENWGKVRIYTKAQRLPCRCPSAIPSANSNVSEKQDGGSQQTEVERAWTLLSPARLQ